MFAICVLMLVLVPAARGQALAPRDSATVARDSAAVAAPGDSAEAVAPADTAEVGEGAIVTTPLRARRTLPKLGRFDQPRWVMLRSLLLPGWGQVHNRAWLKAALVAPSDGLLRLRFIRDERRLGSLNGDASVRGRDLEAADRAVAAAQAELDSAQKEDPPNPERIAAAQAALAAAGLARAGASDAYNTAVLAYNTFLNQTINRRWILGGVVLYALIDAYVDAHFKNFDINLELDPALPGGKLPSGGRLQIRWAF